MKIHITIAIDVKNTLVVYLKCGKWDKKLVIVVSLGELRQLFLAMKVFQGKNISFLFKITIFIIYIDY